MIAFITFKSSLVPLFEGLWCSNSWEIELSGFRRNRTDDLGIDSPLLWPTEPRLHVRSSLTEDFEDVQGNEIAALDPSQEADMVLTRSSEPVV